MRKYETFEITFTLKAKPQFKSKLPEKTLKIAVTLDAALLPGTGAHGRGEELPGVGAT